MNFIKCVFCQSSDISVDESGSTRKVKCSNCIPKEKVETEVYIVRKKKIVD